MKFDWGLRKEWYSIGDKIKWAVDENNRILPQSIINRRGQYNFGDFTISEVLLFDTNVLQLEADKRVCTFCGAPFGLSGVTIRNNRIQSVETFSPDDLLELVGERVPRCLPGCIKWYSDPSRREDINIWDIQEGGFYLPRMEWYDFPLVPCYLEEMELIRMNPGRVAFASREMIISDQWHPKSSAELKISGIPEVLDVWIEFRVYDKNNCILTSIELENKDHSGAMGTGDLFVGQDTMILYFLDPQSLAKGINPKTIERARMEMVVRTDKFEQQHKLLADNEGQICGVMCSTGVGRGQYQAIWGGENGWSLKVRFL